MEWEEVPDAVDAWADALEAPAQALKRAAADAYTSHDVGYYAHPGTGEVALFAESGDLGDLTVCKRAAARASGSPPLLLSYQELADPECPWVKVAYSPVLRRVGELLNFFPGQYPGGLPNAPSPLAAMLTSGLVGAGLGYGAGRLARAVLPEGYGEHLGRTGALVGGLAGVLPGAAWAVAGHTQGHGLTDPWPLDEAGPDAGPESWIHGDNRVARLEKTSAALEAIPLGWLFKAALATFGGYAPEIDPSPADVDIDALGRTLWEAGASPQMTGSTMGVVYTARQLPDPRSRPGIVTGGQLGQLAANATGNYVKGLLVGRALNAVVGTPWSPPAFGAGAAALGVIGAVVPKLFSADPD